MNNTELKNPHDLMQSAYDRSVMASAPRNYLPCAIGEFAKELAINPLLEDIRQTILNIGKKALEDPTTAKIATLDEFEKSIQLIYSYEKTVPALSFIIEEINKVKKKLPAKQ